MTFATGSMFLALTGDSRAGARLSCPEPYSMSRAEIVDAMSRHGSYSITSTTTSMRFGAEALLAMVRARQKADRSQTQFIIRQDDWFAAHVATAGVSPSEMSEAARSGFEHHQDAMVDYGPHVLAQVLEGPRPRLVLDVVIFWADSIGAPTEFSYKDTLSIPQVEVYDQRVIRFKLVEYADMLLFDQISGISVRPLGFLSALFKLIGKPDLRQNRIAVSADQWQVMRGQVNVFAGISKTGVASVDPSGRGHERPPPDRPDLVELQRRLERQVKLRYGPASCQVRRVSESRPRGCPGVMGGAGGCAGR